MYDENVVAAHADKRTCLMLPAFKVTLFVLGKGDLEFVSNGSSKRHRSVESENLHEC